MKKDMLAENVAQTSALKLAQAIKRRIAQRTWGRVCQLRVEMFADRLVVHGFCSTYYSKQLALQAVREIASSVPLELNIYVGATESNRRRDAPHTLPADG